MSTDRHAKHAKRPETVGRRQETVTGTAAMYRGWGEAIHMIGVEFSRKTCNVTAFEVAG